MKRGSLVCEVGGPFSSGALGHNSTGTNRTLSLILGPADEPDSSIVKILSDPEVRTRTLTYLYDLHQADATMGVELASISSSLGISREAVLRGMMYLSEKGLVQTTWMSGEDYFRGARITSSGIDEVEKKEMKGV